MRKSLPVQLIEINSTLSDLEKGAHKLQKERKALQVRLEKMQEEYDRIQFELAQDRKAEMLNKKEIKNAKKIVRNNLLNEKLQANYFEKMNKNKGKRSGEKPVKTINAENLNLVQVFWLLYRKQIQFVAITLFVLSIFSGVGIAYSAHVRSEEKKAEAIKQAKAYAEETKKAQEEAAYNSKINSQIYNYKAAKCAEYTIARTIVPVPDAADIETNIALTPDMKKSITSTGMAQEVVDCVMHFNQLVADENMKIAEYRQKIAEAISSKCKAYASYGSGMIDTFNDYNPDWVRVKPVGDAIAEVNACIPAARVQKINEDIEAEINRACTEIRNYAESNPQYDINGYDSYDAYTSISRNWSTNKDSWSKQISLDQMQKKVVACVHQ